MSLLPLDLTEVVAEELRRNRRPNDHLLHASSHLTGSLRHAQLDVVGAPKVSTDLIREFPLWIGQMMHDWLHDTLRRLGVPYMAEVNVTPWLPKGWGGTADAVIWNPELRAFVLVDFKTQKGEGMRYILRDGAKQEHIWQTSAYWHALKKMGLPLAKSIAVFYLPKNDTRSKDEQIEPVLMDFTPLPAMSLATVMKRRNERVAAYRNSLSLIPGAPPRPTSVASYVTDELEPVQSRVQRVFYDRKTDTHDLKLVPHWSAAFCDFPEELCDCSTQGQTKIGMYDIDGAYYPRPGYESIVPEVSPA